MIDEKVRLLANEEVAQDFYLARLAAPHIAAEAGPGQFVEVRVNEGVSPLLRMPLSVCAADPETGTIELLFEEMGPKSRLLRQMRPGSETACLGPLGRGFRAPPAAHRAVLVGGGIGVPPLLFWGKVLQAKGYQVCLLVGARAAGKHLPEAMLAAAAQEVRRSTDAGSLGRGGLVTDLLEEELGKDCLRTVYACGPHGMMATVAAACREQEVACQVSLEEYMACGIGICAGCGVEVIPEEGASPYERFRRVCVDGPVFDAHQVRWEER